MQQRQLSPWASSNAQGIGKNGCGVGDGEKWASRGVMGDKEMASWVYEGSWVDGGDDALGDDVKWVWM